MTPTAIYVLGNTQPTSIPAANLTALPRANSAFTPLSNAATAEIDTRQTSKNAPPTFKHIREQLRGGTGLTRFIHVFPFIG